MDKINDGGAAFPSAYLGQRGMTLRDWFAGQALAGYLSNMDAVKKGTDWVVAHAYIAADAMLAERAKAGQ